MTEGKYCLLTNDVECHSIWYNTLRDETGRKVLEEGMPLLLDIYSQYNIKSTFFFTGYIAEKYPGVVKMILPCGHEIGSHGYSHKIDHAFDLLPFETQVEHLRKTKDLLEQISGKEVISFRAPALRVNKYTPLALIETGYKIDSSVPSQRFDMFLSFGSLKKLKWLIAPRLPYRTQKNNLSRKGDAPLIEVPLTALIFPYLGTTLRIFPFITRIQRNILKWESSLNKKPVVFDIHPNEFLDEKNEQRIITRRSNNFFNYLLGDIVRAKLKVKNLGNAAVPLYKNEIEFYKKGNYEFTTLRDYCRKQGLIE
jgi:peptidoglycan/xylan/chitin deacetylase (PgdA/CDA1 family)